MITLTGLGVVPLPCEAALHIPKEAANILAAEHAHGNVS